jgi:hypothetical protein
MRLRTTSTERTYRYLRLGIVGVMVLLGVSLGAQIAADGPLGSVSAAYYTPARDIFVGSLCAVALALLALSGRSVEQVLLDLAALFAPVIAIVPTPVAPGEVSGVRVVCPGESPCVPADALPGIANGMLSIGVIGAVGVGAAFVLAAVQHTLSARVVISLAITAAVIAGMLLWWLSTPASFVHDAHDVATIAFFALIAAVATVAAVRPQGHRRRTVRAVRTAYIVIAAGIALALVFLVLVAILRRSDGDSPLPLFFLGETTALGLFVAFWIVQTIELWQRPDPLRVVVTPTA